MNVLMISPGYPAEMAFFTRGLGQAGVGRHRPGRPVAGRAAGRSRGTPWTHYVQVGSLAAEEAGRRDRPRAGPAASRIDQVECLWEPYMVLAARLREQLGLPGPDGGADGAVPGQGADEAAARRGRACARRGTCAAETVAEVWAAAERVGYPLIVKPIDGAGSADTYRADSAAELDAILPDLRHVPQVSVEEFIDGEEFTYDTICAGGQVLFENICQYHPRPLLTKMHEWISPITLALRDLDEPGLQGGRELGAAGAAGARLPRRVHPHGVVPQGRRRGGVRRDRRPPARRPDGRRDELRHRRRPVLRPGRRPSPTGSIPQPVERRYNAASIFKRAQRRRPDHPLRGPGPAAGRVRRARRRARPAPGRRAAAGLAGHHHRRRHGHRPPPRLPPGAGDGPALRRRAAPVRGVETSPARR